MNLNVISTAPDKSGFAPQNQASTPGETQLKITNNGNSDIRFNGVINNPFGSSTVINTLRADLAIQTAGAELVSSVVNLSAPAGKIGSLASPFRVSCVERTGTLVLTASSAGDVFVQQSLAA